MSILKYSIDADTANRLIAAAQTKATGIGKSMAIAVCDETGDLKAYLRMDGASRMASVICQDKAYTSAAARRPTHAYYDRIKDDPPLLHGMVHQPRLVIFGGGYPVVENGHCIGAIGVSGGHYTEDMDVALSALAAIGAQTEF